MELDQLKRIIELEESNKRLRAKHDRIRQLLERCESVLDDMYTDPRAEPLGDEVRSALHPEGWDEI